MEDTGTAGALQVVDTRPIESKLSILKEKADAIVVHDQTSYAIACQLVLEGRAEVKAIGFALDPGITSAKAHLDELRNRKASFVDRVTPIIKAAEQKAESWKAEERRKAQAEEDRINAQRRAGAARIAAEERRIAEQKAEADRKERERISEIERKERERELERQRKAGEIGKREADKQKKLAAEQAERDREEAAEEAERQKALAAKQEAEAAANVQEVKVAPSVPKVAGVRGRVLWKFDIVDPNRIPRAFLMPDDVKIGQMVRSEKDKKRAEGICPGILVKEEDAI